MLDQFYCSMHTLWRNIAAASSAELEESLLLGIQMGACLHAVLS